MNEQLFKASCLALTLGFSVVFCLIVVPPFIQAPDLLGAFAAGFVNPYAAGYSADVFFCWGALALWVIHEAKAYSVRHGWICLVLGIVPGVAVGFALYLVLRSHQIHQTPK